MTNINLKEYNSVLVFFDGVLIQEFKKEGENWYASTGKLIEDLEEFSNYLEEMSGFPDVLILLSRN